MTDTAQVKIDGLADLAGQLPVGEWHELRIAICCNVDGSAAVRLSKTLRRLDVYEADGQLWYRDALNDLQLADY